MSEMRCIIDATHDEKYLTLGALGKPVFFYPIDIAMDSNVFDNICVVDSVK